jgi:putative DNA methylase
VTRTTSPGRAIPPSTSLDRDGVLSSRAGEVTLLRPTDLPAAYDVSEDDHTSAWEALHHLIRILDQRRGERGRAVPRRRARRPDGAVEADLVKELAFLLFSIAEKNGWTKDALAFNTLATSWPDLARRLPRRAGPHRRPRPPSTSTTRTDPWAS